MYRQGAGGRYGFYESLCLAKIFAEVFDSAVSRGVRRLSKPLQIYIYVKGAS